MTSRHNLQPPPVPKQPPAFAVPTSKMTSSAPASVLSSQLAPTLLPVPLPQPPVLPWQTTCIQHTVPLEQLDDFLAQDVQQQAAPEERSTLVHAVAREMDERQSAEHIKQQTWHQMKVDRRKRTMAQPAWKTAMESQQPNSFSAQSIMPASQFPPPSLSGMPSLTTLHETPEEAEVVAPVQPDPAHQVLSPHKNAWCEFQDRNIY